MTFCITIPCPRLAPYCTSLEFPDRGPRDEDVWPRRRDPPPLPLIHSNLRIRGSEKDRSFEDRSSFNAISKDDENYVLFNPLLFPRYIIIMLTLHNTKVFLSRKLKLAKVFTLQNTLIIILKIL